MNCITFDPPVSKGDLHITIDFCSFEVKSGSPFGGIKNLTNGVHLISFSSYSADRSEGAVRYGYWFESGINCGNLNIQYDQDADLFKVFQVPDQDKFMEISHQLHQFMINYPQVEELECSWFDFTQYIDSDQIKSISGTYPGYADSSMTSVEEVQWLNGKLNQSHSADESTFNYTPIKFKSCDAIRDDHKMEDFLDKSYYLNEKIIKGNYQGHLNKLFGEIQISFMNVLLFGNYGSSLQWHNLVELVCFSSQIDANTLKRFDRCVSLQLQRLPEEYAALINEDGWKRCLRDSFHPESLPKIREAIKDIVPEAVDEEANLDDNDDNEDEYKPTIAGGVYYQRF